MVKKRDKETHNLVATAVDETLATFGANLSEMLKVSKYRWQCVRT